MTCRLPMISVHMYSKVKIQYEFGHLECAKPRALRSRDVLVKQVTTLPWHFTPKGALFGPIYGIYVG